MAVWFTLRHFQRRKGPIRLDHIAYRVKNRDAAVKFFRDAFGYRPQEEFEIVLEDGSKARCQSLEPIEKILPDTPFSSDEPFYVSGLDGMPTTIFQEYHLAPEIFISDGPPGSVIDNWVNEWGRGIGGIHHMAFEVADVKAKMDDWKAKGWLFTTELPLNCENLTQVFSMPNPITNVVYEFIERRGQRGFCDGNVAKLMSSTKGLNGPIN